MACNGARGFNCLAIWKNGKKEFKYLEINEYISLDSLTQNFLPKSLKFPQTHLNLIICTPSLIAHIFFSFSSFSTFLFFFLCFSFFLFFSFFSFFLFFIHHFLDLGVQTFLSQPIFRFSQCTYNYTPLATVLILTTNEMSIISRFR